MHQTQQIPSMLVTFFLINSSWASDFNIIEIHFRWCSNHLFFIVNLTHYTRSQYFSLFQRLKYHELQKSVFIRIIQQVRYVSSEFRSTSSDATFVAKVTELYFFFTFCANTDMFKLICIHVRRATSSLW